MEQILKFYESIDKFNLLSLVFIIGFLLSINVVFSKKQTVYHTNLNIKVGFSSMLIFTETFVLLFVQKLLLRNFTAMTMFQKIIFAAVVLVMFVIYIVGLLNVVKNVLKLKETKVKLWSIIATICSLLSIYLMIYDIIKLIEIIF